MGFSPKIGGLFESVVPWDMGTRIFTACHLHAPAHANTLAWVVSQSFTVVCAVLLAPLRSLCPQQQEGSSQNQTRLWHPCDFLKSSSSVLSLKSSAWPFIVCLVFLEPCQALCCLRAFARRPPGGSHGLFWLWPKLHFLRPCLTTSYGTLGSTALIPFIVKPKSDFAHETLHDLSPPCPPLLPPPSHSSPPATLLLEHTVHDAPQGLCTGHSSAWMLSPVL